MAYGQRSAHELYGDDAGAYVLGSLEPDERRAFEAHLVECATCADNVRVLRETTVDLVYNLSRQRPSRAVREKLLSLILTSR